MKRNKLDLDQEEPQILGDFARGEFESIQDFQNEKKERNYSANPELSSFPTLDSRLRGNDVFSMPSPNQSYPRRRVSRPYFLG